MLEGPVAPGPRLPPESPLSEPIPDYSQTPRAEVPAAYQWRITDLFPSEAAWRAELDEVRPLAATLETRAEGWTASSQALRAFMDLLMEVTRRTRNLGLYAGLQGDMDLGDPRFQEMKGEIQSLQVNLEARLAFMEADLLALGQARVEAYLAEEPALEPYRVGFLKTLRLKDHILPEGEARVVATTGLFASASATAAGLLNNVDLVRPEVTLADGRKVLLNASGYQEHRAAKDPADRKLVMETYWAGQKQYAHTFAALLDAGVKHDLFQAQVHHYPACLDAALHPEAIDPAVYRNLITTVKANLAPLHRLLRLRQRMLGLEKLTYSDVYASAVQAVDRKYDYEEAEALVLMATAPLGPEYEAGLRSAFQDGWVDRYPNLGKQSGAYSSGVYGVHPFVKMNFDGRFHNVSTLAHELGHAMHSYLSERSQPYPTADYPILLAEIASTFNENLLMRQLLKTESDDTLKRFLLDSYLETLRGTLFRQTLFADFELSMHERVEQGLTLTAEWLDKTYLELTRLYYGHNAGVMEVPDYIQGEWSGIPHFFYNFYVFQYATGIVASMALADAVLAQEEGRRDAFLAFLRSGSSRFPLDTLKAAGVDLTRPEPVLAALKAFDDLVGELEVLAASAQASEW